MAVKCAVLSTDDRVGMAASLAWLGPEARSTAGFVLFFGLCQAAYVLLVQRPIPVYEIGPEKSVVILDGSSLGADDSPSLEQLMRNPAAVLTFDGNGKRKKPPSTVPPYKPPPSKPSPSKPPPSKPAPPPPLPPPPPQSLPPPSSLASSSSPSPPSDLLPPSACPFPPPSLPPTPAQSDEPPTSSEVGDSAHCRRPSYVWAQNRTHVFVTVKLEAAERKLVPGLYFGGRVLRARVPRAEAGAAQMRVAVTSGAGRSSSSGGGRGSGSSGGGGGGVGSSDGSGGSEACVAIALELHELIAPSRSDWQLTNRGLLLRVRKQSPGHWARLLLTDEYDGKQGIDWARFSHPDATRTERQEARQAEFERLDAIRMREMRTLRPRFDAMLRQFAEANEREEAMEPDEQREMLRLGETILTHYNEEREQRASLRGDAPLPAGVDEEQLERAVLGLREFERKGMLAHDRNTPDWKEWRRRNKERQGVADYAVEMAKAVTERKKKRRSGRSKRAPRGER